jgi:hypothetical protein
VGGTRVTQAAVMARVPNFTPTYFFTLDATVNGEGLFQVNGATGALSVATNVARAQLDRETKVQLRAAALHTRRERR